MSAFYSRFTRRVSATREAMSGADALFLLYVILFAAAVPLLMRLRTRTLERLLYLRHRPGDTASAEAIARVLRHFQLARHIGSPLVGSGCLTRGLTLHYFLRRAGLNVTLCFGIGHVADQFTGHCWLSRAGMPFLEEHDPRSLYTHVFSIPLDMSQPASTARRTLRAVVSS
jgi:hypothetical protein